MIIKFANYTLKLAAIGASVAGVKLINDAIAPTKVVEYLGRSLQVLPRASVVGLSVSTFALVILISAVSDFIINRKFFHLEVRDVENPLPKSNAYRPDSGPIIGRKLLVQWSITVVTGIALSLIVTSIAGAILGTSVGIVSLPATATGAFLGFYVFIARKIADFVFNQASIFFNFMYYYNINKIININVEETLKSARTPEIIVPELGNKKNAPIDISDFLKELDHTIKATIPGKGLTEVKNDPEVMPLRKKALKAIAIELKKLEKIENDRKELIKFYEKREGTKVDKKNKHDIRDLQFDRIRDLQFGPIQDRINVLTHAKDLWEKIDIQLSQN